MVSVVRSSAEFDRFRSQSRRSMWPPRNENLGIIHERNQNSELDFHIWNTKSQSFARSESEAKMAAHEG